MGRGNQFVIPGPKGSELISSPKEPKRGRVREIFILKIIFILSFLKETTTLIYVRTGRDLSHVSLLEKT